MTPASKFILHCKNAVIVSAHDDLRHSVCTFRTIENVLSQSALLGGKLRCADITHANDGNRGTPSGDHFSPDGIKGDHFSPDGIKGDHFSPDGIKGDHFSPDGIKGDHFSPDGIKGDHFSPDGIKSSSISCRSSSSSLKVTRGQESGFCTRRAHWVNLVATKRGKIQRHFLIFHGDR